MAEHKLQRSAVRKYLSSSLTQLFTLRVTATSKVADTKHLSISAHVSSSKWRVTDETVPLTTVLIFANVSASTEVYVRFTNPHTENPCATRKKQGCQPIYLILSLIRSKNFSRKDFEQSSSNFP